MAFTNNIDTSLPSGTENANTLDDIARGIKVEVKERFDSLTTGCDIDPMRLKAGAIPSGYAMTSPTITGASLINPTLSGTITGIPLQFPAYAVGSAVGFTPALNSWIAVGRITSLPAGTYLLTGNGAGSVFPNVSFGVNFRGRIRNVTTSVAITGPQSAISSENSLQALEVTVIGLLTLGSTTSVDFEIEISSGGGTISGMNFGGMWAIRVA